MKINSVFSKALAVATVVATSIGFQSCLDDDDNNAYYLRYPNALVTVKELSLIHISEPTRQAEISYAVFCLKKKKHKTQRKTCMHTLIQSKV